MTSKTLHTNIILELYEIQAVRLGSFTLKSGIESPIYFDLKLIVSYPALLKKIADALWEKIKSLCFDLICGVPYGAIPLASILSVEHDISMILQRKEKKEHGTKKQVEGVYFKGQTCLLVEDVITSGASLIETIESLKAAELAVRDVAIIIDREQGGKKILEQKGVRVHSLFNVTELLQILHEEGKISDQLQSSVLTFIKNNQF